jgi:hypothetical protein
MQCSHCLRGEAMRKTIDDNHINQLFLSLKDETIGTLTITGGEPSLVPHKIKTIIQAAMWNNVAIQNFYIVTNAKRITAPFIDIVKTLHDYCDENEVSQLVASNDVYHFDSLHDHDRFRENVTKMEIEFNGYFTGMDDPIFSLRDDNERDYYDTISQGRAKYSGKQELTPNYYNIEHWDDQVNIGDGSIYVNAKGVILSECNLSFETQDNPESIFKIGVVTMDTDFVKICKESNKKLETEVKMVDA